MSENVEIPKGWVWTKLGDVCEIILGQSPTSDTYNLIKEGLPFFQGKAEFTELYPIPEKWCSKPNKIAEPFDVLLSVRAPVGATNIADQQCCIGRGLAAIRYSENYKFICHYLKSIEQILDAKGTGTTFKAISGEIIREQNIHLPPLPEQHRIVAKIEALFSSLDKGIESLKTAQQQLKVYRQAVLKWAFEGKLTNENVKDGELPKGWKWKQLKEITSVLGDGLHGTPVYSESGEYYFINGNNLSDGKVEIKENTKRIAIAEYEKYKKPLNENTIFISINGTLGNTAFYNGENVVLGKSACYFNVLNTVDKQYGRYCITSQRFINYAHKNATGSTIKNVGLKAMREFEIPLPPTIEEQHAIVSEIESRLSVCDKLEESITHSLKQAEALRQSVLKKAFSGKLVPQDPNDAPASVLLERIKAEKEKNMPDKKVKVKKVKN